MSCGELGTRQRDLEGRLTAAESKMKDRRMRITRIRNDKELGLAKREVDLLKEEISGLETELQSRCSSRSTRPTKQLEAARRPSSRALTDARDAEAEQLRDTIGASRRRRSSAIAAPAPAARRRASTASSAGATR